jgi:hypothetical protein
MSSPRRPRPFGSEQLATLPVAEVVGALAIPHRARAAFWRLVEIGPSALPEVRDGLSHPDPAVRRGCCEFVDLYPDHDALADVAVLLDDPDPDVRRMAGHALACARCKRPETWEKRPVR